MNNPTHLTSLYKMSWGLMHTIMSHNYKSDCTKVFLIDIFRNMKEISILLNSHVRESLFTRLHLYLFLGKKRSEDTNKNLYLEKSKCKLCKIQIRIVIFFVNYLHQWSADRAVPEPICPFEQSWSANGPLGGATWSWNRPIWVRGSLICVPAAGSKYFRGLP